jgi:hypothetical protein
MEAMPLPPPGRRKTTSATAASVAIAAVIRTFWPEPNRGKHMEYKSTECRPLRRKPEKLLNEHRPSIRRNLTHQAIFENPGPGDSGVELLDVGCGVRVLV